MEIQVEQARGGVSRGTLTRSTTNQTTKRGLIDMRMMKVMFVAAALLLSVGVNVEAQRRGDGDHYRRWGREPLDRVRADLNRAERHLDYLPREEMRRFRHVREAINHFQSDWEQGHFDVSALDDAIGALSRLVERSRLHERDRDNLADDLRRMRELREHWERRNRD